MKGLKGLLMNLLKFWRMFKKDYFNIIKNPAIGMTKIAGINLLSNYCVTALCWATMLFLIIYRSPFHFLYQ